MLTKSLLFAAVLSIGSFASAQDAAAPTLSPMTARAAKKAHVLLFAGGGSQEILAVDAGRNDRLNSVEVVYDSRGINIPGSTISAAEKRGRLKTSMTLKDLSSR